MPLKNNCFRRVYHSNWEYLLSLEKVKEVSRQINYFSPLLQEADAEPKQKALRYKQEKKQQFREKGLKLAAAKTAEAAKSA